MPHRHVPTFFICSPNEFHSSGQLRGHSNTTDAFAGFEQLLIAAGSGVKAVDRVVSTNLLRCQIWAFQVNTQQLRPTCGTTNQTRSDMQDVYQLTQGCRDGCRHESSSATLCVTTSNSLQCRRGGIHSIGATATVEVEINKTRGNVPTFGIDDLRINGQSRHRTCWPDPSDVFVCK
jgi:hypothetical protein